MARRCCSTWPLLRSWIAEACAGYEDRVSAKAIAEEVLAGLPAGAPLADLERSIVLAARTRIESDPAYSFVAARALLRGLYAEALGRRVGIDEARAAYPWPSSSTCGAGSSWSCWRRRCSTSTWTGSARR